MARGGIRPGAGRKKMADDVVRTTVILDQATRDLIDKHGGRSRAAYIRDCMGFLLSCCEDDLTILEAPISGETRQVALKLSRALLNQCQRFIGGSAFQSMSGFIRTAVQTHHREKGRQPHA